MGSLTSILNKLDERSIAKNIGIPHDEARMNYQLSSNTVSDIDEFRKIIGDYYNYHFTTCVSHGGTLSSVEAQGRAKEILENVDRNRVGNFVGVFNDAHEGTNGGLRTILDRISNQLKAESIERYIRGVFDDEVKSNSWDDKVEIIKQFMSHCGPDISQSLDVSKPERYASNYNDLIRAYVDSLRKTSSIFRRL